jgi:hypothetical protein
MAYTTLFDTLKKALTREGLSFNVTKRALTLGARDAVTGWAAKSYVESTVEMIIINQSNRQLAVQAGTYVRSDALGFSKTVFVEGDQMKDDESVYYEVEAVRPRKIGNKLVCYEYDLTIQPLGVY